MNRSKLKTYAPQARRDFIQAVTDRAAVYGLMPAKIELIIERGDVAIIGGKPFPISVADKRRRLEERITRRGFEQVMEAMAYTWFNRLVAIRYMEIHGYLDHGYRVLSNPEPDKTTPEIVEHAEHRDLPGLDKAEVIALKLDGTKETELYRMLLLAQCNALHKAMPFLFERIDDETELLLPDNLLHSDSIIRKLVNEIEEADWQEVEIIGWLYQFYISERKGQVIGKVVKSEDIPAATQLFTPNWIVKYLVQNSLGRQWLATYPQSPLRGKMEFYIEPAEQKREVQAELEKITPESLNPEDLTLMDPACGSGHILVEAYDLLKKIYLERGYRLRDIPKLILTKNLFGLEIDDRAAQLAAFALMMKARADDRRIFVGDAQPNVLAIQESNGLNVNAIVQAFTEKKITDEGDLVAGEFGFMGAVRAPLFATENRAAATVDEKTAADLKAVLALFENAKTVGSLLTIPAGLVEHLPSLAQSIRAAGEHSTVAAATATTFLWQSHLLATKYRAVVTNPPYLGAMNACLKDYLGRCYPNTKYNLFSAFIERATSFSIDGGYAALVTLHAWMFRDRYEAFRRTLLNDGTLLGLAHLGGGAFPEISGEVVQSCAFVVRSARIPGFTGMFHKLVDGDSLTKARTIKEHTGIVIRSSEFLELPGAAILYWASRHFRDLLKSEQDVGRLIATREGMTTGDNDRFLRRWWEVDIARTSINGCLPDSTWFPYIKGGDFRKWYGNFEYVVNWYADGSELRNFRDGVSGRIRSHNYNGEFAFREGLTWSSITSSALAVRFVPRGCLFDTTGPMAFVNNPDHRGVVMAVLNSRIAFDALKTIAPVLHFKLGHVERIPLPAPLLANARLGDLADKCLRLSREDWDSSELSWGFGRCPLLVRDTVRATLSAVAQSTRTRWSQLCEYEGEIDRIVADEYQMEARASVSIIDGICPETQPYEAMCWVFSFLVGCAMGRYSLDKPGLIYANGGNEGFDPSQYKTFPADEDGIIPVTEIDWFLDDVAHRFEEFVAVAWPKEHLEENLTFVADSLGAKNSDQPRDTIRRYFADDFYKHHLQTYKRRPIYWLFTSGKLGAFQCLVYLHRYHEGTLARMRTEYVIPLQGKINARIDQLEGDTDKANSTAHRKRLEKEQQLLKKQQVELQKFDEQLRHYADIRIKLDLDDGVKVNYGKFGNLLAYVTQVCGKNGEKA